MKILKIIFSPLKSYLNNKYNRDLKNSLLELQKINPNFSVKFIDIGAAEGIHPRWKRNDFNGFGQCVFGDPLFLKSPENILKTEDENLLSRYIAILLLYKRFDLIDVCFMLFDSKKNKEFGSFKRSLKNHRRRFDYLKLCDRWFNRIIGLVSPDNKTLIHY